MQAGLFSCAGAGAATGNGTQGGAGGMIIMVVMLIAVFAIMIIPQKRREKKVKAMLDAVKVNDRVRTIGGIYGTVVAVKEDLITVESTPGTQIVFAKGAISTVENAEVEAADLQK